jgi:hypothetical protein
VIQIDVLLRALKHNCMCVCVNVAKYLYRSTSLDEIFSEERMSAQGVMGRNLPITPCALTLLYVICKYLRRLCRGERFMHVCFQYLAHFSSTSLNDNGNDDYNKLLFIF